MQERPTGVELLIVARKLLLEELLPLLPNDRRYDALMIANAMGIASRQSGFGNDFERQEHHDLEVLLGKTDTEDTPNRDSDDLVTLYRTLCARIRDGKFDPGTPDWAALHGFLQEVTVQRLRESAPKILETAGVK